jgi:hypothetical protein
MVRGLHLHVAREVVKSSMRLHWGFRRRPRHGAKGGGRPAVGERRRGVRLGRSKKEAEKSFLTTRMSLGRRESGDEDGGGEDRRRRPSFNVR